MKLLLVEDEQKLALTLAEALRHRGHVVDIAYEGNEGESLARINPYDVIILDRMLPRKDGLSICLALRAHSVTTPILFLTAKGDELDIVEGLDAGGDDYLVKPFSLEELSARLRSLTRRPHLLESPVLTLDNLTLDPKAQTVTIDGKSLTLTLREFALLEYFLRNKQTVITREDILEHVWDREFDSFSNVVDVHLKNLRKKLPKSYAKRIQTIWGKGYKLDA